MTQLLCCFLLVAFAVAASAQPPMITMSTTIVVSPIAGVATARSEMAIIGMRFPLFPMVVPATDTTRDRVPDYLGATIRWDAYTVDGRHVGTGTRDLAWSHARKLVLSASDVQGPGLRVVVCRGVGRGVGSGVVLGAIWRTRLWIAR